MIVLPALVRPVPRRRMAPLVAIFVTAFMLAVAGQASAAVLTVNLDGAATGTVTSSPPGINCSNTGGGTPGPDCSFNFLPLLSTVELTATPDAPALFIGWAGNAFRSTCNSGSVNPCGYTVAAAATVTATFDPPPDPPVVATSPAASVRPYSAQMKGTVNPGGSPVGSCSFEFGRTEDYGKTIDCQPISLGSGSTEVEVTGYLSRLEPDTTYHYRVTAENAGGISKSDDRSFTTGPVPSDSCPNAAIRAQQRIELPYCMALEMVSPPNKSNFKASFATIGADGDAIRFFSLAALGGSPSLVSPVKGDSYVAERTDGGWETRATTTPVPYSTNGKGNPNVFSADLRRWFALSATHAQIDQGILAQFDGGIATDWSIRNPLLVPLASSANPAGGNSLVATATSTTNASADLSHVFFQPASSGRYLPGDPAPPTTGSDVTYTYVSARHPGGSESLELLARDGGGQVWGGNCDNIVGGGVNASASVLAGGVQQGAVSPDGRRVFFMARPSQPANGACDAAQNKLRIMKRLEAPGGAQISVAVSNECDRAAPACDATDGDDFFQGASADGTKVYFTTPRQLVNGDLDTGSACSNTLASSSGCDLYLLDSTRPAGQRLTQVSAGDETDVTPGVGANVARSIVGVSGDGSRAYFVSPDVLTTDANPLGQAAVAGQPNLYVFHRAGDGSDELSFVATLAAADGGTGTSSSTKLFGSETSTMRNGGAVVPLVGEDPGVGGDGHILVFQSAAALTSDDLDGAQRDVYRYDSVAETLVRVSKAGPGGGDNGAYDVDEINTAGTFSVAGPDSAETTRWVSEDGDTITFATPEGLVDGNVNARAGVYLWRDGELVALPGDGSASVLSTGGRTLDTPVVSRTGDEVAFMTADRLLSDDGDISRDVYVARVGGGFPPEAAPSTCDSLGGGCQGGGFDPVSTAANTLSSSESDNAKVEARKTLAVFGFSRKARRRASRSGWLSMVVRVSSAGRVTLTVKAKAGKKHRRVGRASKRLKAGKSRVSVRLNRKARKRLRSGKRMRLTVQVRQAGARTRTRGILLPGVKS